VDTDHRCRTGLIVADTADNVGRAVTMPLRPETNTTHRPVRVSSAGPTG